LTIADRQRNSSRIPLLRYQGFSKLISFPRARTIAHGQQVGRNHGGLKSGRREQRKKTNVSNPRDSLDLDRDSADAGARGLSLSDIEYIAWDHWELKQVSRDPRVWGIVGVQGGVGVWARSPKAISPDRCRQCTPNMFNEILWPTSASKRSKTSRTSEIRRAGPREHQHSHHQPTQVVIDLGGSIDPLSDRSPPTTTCHSFMYSLGPWCIPRPRDP
jgi:hypothetical protein